MTKLYEVTERLPDGRERSVHHPNSQALTMRLDEAVSAAKSARWAVTIREIQR